MSSQFLRWQRSWCLLRMLLVAGLISSLVSCTVTQSQAVDQSSFAQSDWESGLYVDHPLVGSIWNSRAGAFVEVSDLLEAVQASRYFLLGEKHDNPDHHTLQLKLLDSLLTSKSVASVSLEMLDSSADPRLQSVGDRRYADLEELKNHLAWDEEGWDWSFYGPLIQRTLQAGVELRSANISNQRMGEIYGQPLAEYIASVLDISAIEQLNAEIDASHCNMLPASQFPAMVGIQQTRDHQMATSLTNASRIPATSGQLRVLIAGNYHIRQDLSVPNYILALDDSATRHQVVSLAILEVQPDAFDPLEYQQAYSTTNPYDFIWFTPAISDEDYCASLQR